MSDVKPKPQRSGGGRGRPILWLVLLAAFAGATAGTIAITKANPLYSNVERNGISKYKFIEQCKEVIQEELDKVQEADKGAPISFELNPHEAVENTIESPDPKGGWNMRATLTMHRKGYPTQSAPIGCAYEKGGKAEIIPVQ